MEPPEFGHQIPDAGPHPDEYWGGGGCGALALAFKNMWPDLKIGMDTDNKTGGLNHAWVHDGQRSHDFQGTHDSPDGPSGAFGNETTHMDVDPAHLAKMAEVKWSPEEPWGDKSVDRAGDEIDSHWLRRKYDPDTGEFRHSRRTADDPISEPVRLYRGINLPLEHPDLKQLRDLVHSPEGLDHPDLGGHLLHTLTSFRGDDRKADGSNLGLHWTPDLGVAEDFAHGDNDNSPEYKEPFPVLVSADWHGKGEDKDKTWAGGDYPDEQERHLNPGAPLSLHGVHIWNPTHPEAQYGWHKVVSTPQDHFARRTADHEDPISDFLQWCAEHGPNLPPDQESLEEYSEVVGLTPEEYQDISYYLGYEDDSRTAMWHEAMADTTPWHPLIRHMPDKSNGFGTHDYGTYVVNVPQPDSHEKTLGSLEYSTERGRNYPTFHVESLSVHPEHQGKGIAQALIERAHQDHPDHLIDPGFTTGQGGALTQHLMKAIPGAEKKMDPNWDWELSPLDEEGEQNFLRDEMSRYARWFLRAEDYRGQHTSPGPDGTGFPIHDMHSGGQNYELGGVPEDWQTHPQYYASSHEAPGVRGMKQTQQMYNRVNGNPEAPVDIYRALPQGHGHFHTGDWVTPSLEYARGHAASEQGPEHDWPVIKSTVPAKHLWQNGDSYYEMGYHGPSHEGTVV
jgi:GNAT superfamily N-acetyltransferase